MDSNSHFLLLIFFSMGLLLTSVKATTESWNYLGMPLDVKRNKTGESNIIVAVLDSGIDPYHECFNDEGFGPPPAKWKGSCGPFENITCNNKIIGAKWFKSEDTEIPQSDIASPLDYTGHGTILASIIAGNNYNTSIYGLAKGIAHGGVPLARIAVYKIGYNNGRILDEDTFSGFLAAIDDGVDIINLSIGFPGEDLPRAGSIGSFAALEMGILTVASAGNWGPDSGTVSNQSPWLLTVAASNINRQFVAKVMLGNGKNVTGISLNVVEVQKPIIRSIDAKAVNGSLDPSKVADKIVFHAVDGPSSVDSAFNNIKAAGAAGVIIEVPSVEDVDPSLTDIPLVVLERDQCRTIYDYLLLGSNRDKNATIFNAEEVEAKAPRIPLFSSRGPNTKFPSILKPDVIAPGVNLLSAAVWKDSYSTHEKHSAVTFSTGTSEATPIVAAASAYVKSFHPTWSPAAIKSALMTTDPDPNTTEAIGEEILSSPPPRVVDPSSTSKGDAEYAYGAGQIDPVRAIDPGLVYDTDFNAYMSFLCKEITDTEELNEYTGSDPSHPISCTDFPKALGEDGLNYPSIQYIMKNNNTKQSKHVYHREVTNVGEVPAVYTATITAPTGIEICVKPTKLTFTQQNEKKSFEVSVKIPVMKEPKYVFSGSLVWSDKIHRVRSPIVIHFPWVNS